MGLFDNLFLDQNTPVTINDGIDHSKDVVTPIVDPDTDNLSSAKEVPPPAKPQKVGKNDHSIDDLFDADKKEENAADAKLKPEPPRDVALEIGRPIETPDAPTNAIAPADPSMATPDFDIGGDISFDSIPASVVDESPQITETAGVTGLDPITLTPLDPTLSATPEPAPVPGAPTDTPSEASLSGTFLGGDSAGAPAAAIANPGLDISDNPSTPEASAVETPPAPVEGEGSILDLIGGTPDAPAVPEGVQATPPAPAIVSPSLTSDAPAPAPQELATPFPTQGMNDAIGGFTGLGNMGSTSAEALLGRDALALFSGAGQSNGLLREKLYNFIEELKVLHSRDQSQRNHKLEQIAMYEERIREIDAEAANRKRVLQAEIDDLRRQVEFMDAEKNNIQEVISTFHKEIGNS